MKTHISQLLPFLLILLFSIYCNEDKKKFELAENEFNQGNISAAKLLYEECIQKYPTSEWRNISDRQLEKCNTIIKLQKDAIELESNKKFGEARNTYFDILRINKKAIDSLKVFSQLSEKIIKYEAEQEEKEKEDIKRKQAIYLKNKNFIKNLGEFLELLNVTGQLYISGIQRFDNTTETNNELFVELVEKLMTNSISDDAIAKVKEAYLKIKNPPEKYSECVTEIEKSYKAFNELIHTLNNIQNYSRFTLRNQLATLDIDISASINNLEVYLPNN